MIRNIYLGTKLPIARFVNVKKREDRVLRIIVLNVQQVFAQDNGYLEVPD